MKRNNFYTNLIETYDDMIEDIEEKMEEYEDKATTYYIITGLLVSVAIVMLILAITQAKRANRNAYAPYGASYGYMAGEQYINQYGQPTYPSNENNTPYGNYNNSPTGYVNNQFSQHYENNQNNQNNQ